MIVVRSDCSQVKKVKVMKRFLAHPGNVCQLTQTCRAAVVADDLFDHTSISVHPYAIIYVEIYVDDFSKMFSIQIVFL